MALENAIEDQLRDYLVFVLWWDIRKTAGMPTKTPMPTLELQNSPNLRNISRGCGRTKKTFQWIVCSTEILNLGIHGIWGQTILCHGGLSSASKAVSSIPGLHPLGASSKTFSFNSENKNVSRHCQKHPCGGRWGV